MAMQVDRAKQIEELRAEIDEAERRRGRVCTLSRTYRELSKYIRDCERELQMLGGKP
jgi:hypothetical protein